MLINNQIELINNKIINIRVGSWFSISLRKDNMGSSSSKSNISTFKLVGTIRAKPNFDPEESAKNIRKALKSKSDS